MDEDREARLRAAIGPRADFYLKRWAAMDASGRKTSWNWAACLLSVFWFAYRKLWWPMLAMGLAYVVATPLIDPADRTLLRAVMFTLVGLSFLAGGFGNWLYRRRVAPGRPDTHYLWVGRFSGFAITMLGVLYAIFLIESVLYTFLLTETMATFVGISILGGILWRRANRWGALASLMVALTTNFTIIPSSKFRIGVSTLYSDTKQHTPDNGNNIYGVWPNLTQSHLRLACTEIAPTGSSMRRRSSMSTPSTTSTPAMTPTSIDSSGAMTSQPAVIATRPASVPLRIMLRSGLPRSSADQPRPSWASPPAPSPRRTSSSPARTAPCTRATNGFGEATIRRWDILQKFTVPGCRVGEEEGGRSGSESPSPRSLHHGLVSGPPSPSGGLRRRFARRGSV